jgi:hypothetical protein
MKDDDVMTEIRIILKRDGKITTCFSGPETKETIAIPSIVIMGMIGVAKIHVDKFFTIDE